MKKKSFIILLLFIFCCLLVGCSASNEAMDSGVSAGENNATVETTRKIYYTVTYTVETLDIREINTGINSKVIELNGYVSDSNSTGNYAKYVYRIPTSVLNDFLNYVDSFGENIKDKTIKSTDVTTTYSQLEARKEILEASRSAYLKLLDESKLSLSGIIELQNKIDEIDTELLYINNKLSSYDNLLDYSTITITYNENEKEEGFFVNYGNYLVGLGEIIFYIFMYGLPLALVAGAVLLIVTIINKRKKKNSNIIQ